MFLYLWCNAYYALPESVLTNMLYFYDFFVFVGRDVCLPAFWLLLSQWNDPTVASILGMRGCRVGLWWELFLPSYHFFCVTFNGISFTILAITDKNRMTISNVLARRCWQVHGRYCSYDRLPAIPMDEVVLVLYNSMCLHGECLKTLQKSVDLLQVSVSLIARDSYGFEWLIYAKYNFIYSMQNFTCKIHVNDD